MFFGERQDAPPAAGGARRAIGLRRYLAPQRDAMSHLHGERVSWLDDLDRARLRDVTDRVAAIMAEMPKKVSSAISVASRSMFKA